MKKAFLILVIMMSTLGSMNAALSLQTSILEQRNEYGGRTEEELYSAEDPRYQEGLAKLIQYFDGNDRMIKLESYYHDNHSMVDGIERTVQYFDNRFFGTGTRTRVEFAYTDAYARSEGLARAIEYFDEKERRIKIDYFYTDAYAKRRQTAHLEILYDAKGSILKRTYTDKEGRVLSSEARE